MEYSEASVAKGISDIYHMSQVRNFNFSPCVIAQAVDWLLLVAAVDYGLSDFLGAAPILMHRNISRP